MAKSEEIWNINSIPEDSHWVFKLLEDRALVKTNIFST